MLFRSAAIAVSAAGRFSQTPRPALMAMAVALACLLAGACLLAESLGAALLFFAAALWGAICALQLGVEHQRPFARRGSIGGASL